MTVNTSAPFGVPERPTPKVYTFPLDEILVGVALERLAAPPLRVKAKSEDSSAPLPPLVLKTASDKVTAIVLLFEAIDTDEIVGGSLSFRVFAPVL